MVFSWLSVSTTRPYPSSYFTHLGLLEVAFLHVVDRSLEVPGVEFQHSLVHLEDLLILALADLDEDY